MNVVFTTDAKYVPHVAAAIASLILNNPLCQIDIYLLFAGGPCGELLLLERMISAYKSARLYTILLDGDILTKFEHPGHISRATYARLYVADLLPKSVAKSLYLDSDIIIRGDVSQLYSADIEKHSIGAVQDLPVSHADLGFAPGEPYFNAGVLLLNLDRWRQSDQTRTLIALALSGRTFRWHDQDILNLHFKGEVLFLDIKWNFHAVWAERPNWFRMSRRDFKELRAQAPIIHYTTPTKPWLYLGEVQYRELYYHYLSFTPFKNAVPPDKTTRNQLYKLTTMLALKRRLKWYMAPVIEIRNPFRNSASRRGEALECSMSRCVS